jgi:hypothetical protein
LDLAAGFTASVRALALRARAPPGLPRAGRAETGSTTAVVGGLVTVERGEKTAGQRGIEEHPDLVALVDDMPGSDFIVLCSLVVARVMMDLGPERAAAFWATATGSVARDIAAANATEARPKD